MRGEPAGPGHRMALPSHVKGGTFPKASVSSHQPLGLWLGVDVCGQNKVTKAQKKRHKAGTLGDDKAKARSFCDP